MGELGDLLELLHGSAEPRFRTLAGEFRTWRHEARSHAAFRAAAERADGTTSIRVGRGTARPDETVTTTRLWVEHPGRVREEVASEHADGRFGVRDGGRWWTYDPRNGALSHEDDPRMQHGIGVQLALLLAPAPLLGQLRFEPAGAGERLGRPTRLVRAFAREDAVGSRGIELH